MSSIFHSVSPHGPFRGHIELRIRRVAVQLPLCYNLATSYFLSVSRNGFFDIVARIWRHQLQFPGMLGGSVIEDLSVP